MKNRILLILLASFLLLFGACGTNGNSGSQGGNGNSGAGHDKPSTPDPVCGDKKVDPATEKCDIAITSGPGACTTIAACEAELMAKPPAEQACKKAEISGTQCQQECTIVDVTNCSELVHDGCCPSNCNRTNDVDCSDFAPVTVQLGDRCDDPSAEYACADLSSGGGSSLVVYSCYSPNAHSTLFYPSLCTRECTQDSDCAGATKPMKCSSSNKCLFSCEGSNTCPRGYTCSSKKTCEPIEFRDCTTDDDCTKPDKGNGEFGNVCFDNQVLHKKVCTFISKGSVPYFGECTQNADCNGGPQGAGPDNGGVGVVCLRNTRSPDPTKGYCYPSCVQQSMDSCTKINPNSHCTEAEHFILLDRVPLFAKYGTFCSYPHAQP